MQLHEGWFVLRALGILLMYKIIYRVSRQLLGPARKRTGLRPLRISAIPDKVAGTQRSLVTTFQVTTRQEGMSNCAQLNP